MIHEIDAHFHIGCICHYIILIPNFRKLVAPDLSWNFVLQTKESKFAVEFSDFDQMFLFVIQVIKSC